MQGMYHILFLFHLSVLVSSAATQSCSSYKFSGSNHQPYASCQALPVLNSFLHWTHHKDNNTVLIAYRATGAATSRWYSWAINIQGSGMIGAQCLVAYQDSTGVLQAYTSSISSYNTGLRKAALSFNVPSLSAELVSETMIIYATIQLPTDQMSFNHVWQEGPVNENSLGIHSTTGDNLQSTAIVDFSSINVVPPPPPNNKTKTLPEDDDNGGSPSKGNQTCPPYSFSGNRIYRSCISLSLLNSFLHWNYNKPNNTVDIAYRHAAVTSSQWVSWALNLQNTGMIGAQCLVAYVNSSNGVLHVYTSSITEYNTDMPQTALSFNVSNISGEFLNQTMIIYATLVLPAGKTVFNHVWQDGPMFGAATPGKHLTTGSNMRSFGTVDFLNTETSTMGRPSSSFRTAKSIHGILNAMSWGVMMPLGAMTARYLKVFKSTNPTWFYIHVVCQTSAYIVGVTGLATGLKLQSEHSDNHFHKRIGIILVVIGTLQVFALLLRPNRDHKYRFYWNMYHWGCGYATIILSIINIFDGIQLLNPGKAWKQAYIGILAFFGINAVFLEVYTWIIVLKIRNKGRTSPKYTFAGINGQISDYGS